MAKAVSLNEQLAEAIKKAIESGPKRKFKESIEMIIVFRELDLKNPDSRIRETVFLPHPPKKKVNICLVADGDFAVQAKNAGADMVIDRSMLEELSKSRKEAKKIAKKCDWVLVQTDLMPIAGRALGPVLGPRGKIPVPIPPRGSPEAAINRYRRAVLVRIKDQPQIQVRIGTVDNSIEELVENATTILQTIENKFKTLSNVQAVYFKKTMGEPVKLRLR